MEEEKKQSPDLFNKIAQRYDRFNRVSTVGYDLVWRRKASKQVPRNATSLIDIACGTGDQLFSTLAARPQLKKLYGLDLAAHMLEIARAKSQQRGHSHEISWLHASATQIPIANETIDVATLSFGIRNMPDPVAALEEIHRVLKQDGKLIILEFSLPPRKSLRFLHYNYLRFCLPLLGKLITGQAAPYRYLSKTIGSFPFGEDFCQLLKQAGFTTTTSHPLSFGAVTLYSAIK